MGDLHSHRVAAARFDYEYLGKSVAELATQYEFPVLGLTEEIELHDWSRKIEPTELPDTRDMQKFADSLEKITRSKLSIISLFRQIDNQSLYAQIETALLQKILEAATDLSAMDDKMSTKLTNLAKAVASIQERNPIQLADQFKESLEANGGQAVVVNIANQVN